MPDSRKRKFSCNDDYLSNAVDKDDDMESLADDAIHDISYADEYSNIDDFATSIANAFHGTPNGVEKSTQCNKTFGMQQANVELELAKHNLVKCLFSLQCEFDQLTRNLFRIVGN
ncbi:hypothetical protein ACA910_020691 [Epithemia clementina (nom. ined.)]